MSIRDYFIGALPIPHKLLSISYNPDARYTFVNFSTKVARMMAIQRAASVLFNGKRLDCRIRCDGLTRSAKVNYGLALGAPQSFAIHYDSRVDLNQKVEELSHFPETHSSQHGKEKHLIIKSYSLEALYQSLGTGVWHVPKRHVDRLNNAFQVRYILEALSYRNFLAANALFLTFFCCTPSDSKQSLPPLLREWFRQLLRLRYDTVGD